MATHLGEPDGRSATPSVAVIGAGMGGIATGVKLKRAGVHRFTIYEASGGIGGTWWHNTYPGAEVDVGSHLYSFSFQRHSWTRTHARQPELQRYLEQTIDDFGLRPHLRLGVAVVAATWDEHQQHWELELGDGTITAAQVLVSAVGFLNAPRLPDWPGLDRFTGRAFHTARWEHDCDLTGKIVAVVGTGSSATQVVPAIQPIVAKLFVFQREPGWVMPKGERDFDDAERALLNRPWRSRRERARQRWQLEKNLWGNRLNRVGTPLNQAREEACRRYIARSFANRPDLAAAVTPSYPYPGKRPVLASTYYPTLKAANVELVPKAVASITPTGVVDSDGVERPVDVIVMATGFRAADYLGDLPVRGRDGRTLQEHWAGEPRAFLGIEVPGFPNFFMLYGPGTNGGEIVMMLESQAEYVVAAVKRMRRTGRSAVEVRPWLFDAWDRWLQRRMAGTSWALSANYFRSPTGRVVTQWPSGNLHYRALTKLLAPIAHTSSHHPRPPPQPA